MPTFDADGFRAASSCLCRPKRLEALARLAGYPSMADRLGNAIDLPTAEVVPLLADLVRHGLVYERSAVYHATAFGHRAAAFARECPGVAGDDAGPSRDPGTSGPNRCRCSPRRQPSGWPRRWRRSTRKRPDPGATPMDPDAIGFDH